jgi:hypothetical protein
MKTFKDNGGQSWAISINVDAIKRVRSLLDVNLLDAVDGKLLEQLVTDPVLLCDVIYCIVKPECDTKNISDEDFGKAMAGDAIEHATTALLEELVDFFPLAKRRVLQKALGKLKALEARALEVAEKHLDSPELEAEMEKALNGVSPTRTIGDSFGNSLASSESTPVP